KITLSSDYFQSVARVMAEAAEALQHAHGVKILHRDVTPSNIMVNTAGECRLIDFGLARWENGRDRDGSPPANSDNASHSAQTHGPLGTPGYMSPEQHAEQADERSDVWGLGVTLYELLTWRRAFEGRNYEEIKEN